MEEKVNNLISCHISCKEANLTYGLSQYQQTYYTICRIDADANAVALYAVALVKKEVPESELKPAVISDLQVFLQESK